MRFHILMLLVVILVSLGMHGMASAGEPAARVTGSHAAGFFQLSPAWPRA
jgi:hypothetical protein